MARTCEICDRIGTIHDGTHPSFIAELPETYAVLADPQGSEGWCVLLLKEHREHLADLPIDRQTLIFSDVARVAGAIRDVLRPRRINYECLGNLVAHVHWHVIPRHANDPDPARPVWAWPADRRHANISNECRRELIRLLRAALTSH